MSGYSLADRQPSLYLLFFSDCIDIVENLRYCISSKIPGFNDFKIS